MSTPHINKIVLGTVQLGLPYGINNHVGKPTGEQAVSILEAAYQHGIRFLDTAEAYGTSQEVIGAYHQLYPSQPFDVITKCKTDNATHSEKDFINAFLKNLDDLKVNQLDAYLFHSFDHYRNFRNWESITYLRNKKMLRKVGVSLYTNEQVGIAAADPRIEVIQLPFNALDNLSQRKGALGLLTKQGKEVHIRSVFLQGLFFKDRNSLGKLSPLGKSLHQLDAIANRFNIEIGALALGYVLLQPMIQKVLIGIDTEEQLNSNIEMLSQIENLGQELLHEIDHVRVLEKELLNPVNW